MRVNNRTNHFWLKPCKFVVSRPVASSISSRDDFCLIINKTTINSYKVSSHSLYDFATVNGEAKQINSCLRFIPSTNLTARLCLQKVLILFEESISQTSCIVMQQNYYTFIITQEGKILIVYSSRFALVFFMTKINVCPCSRTKSFYLIFYF